MKKFTRHQWEQVQTLFHRALEQEEGFNVDRDEVADPAILAEARKLVRFHLSGGSFLDPPTWAEGLGPRDAALELTASPAHTSGDLIGAFRLTSKLNEGGMGEVWLAQRADPQFRQTVAIKILKFARTPAMLQRFLDERDALARLEHPSITRLIDGGITPAGEPFLVMEYVDGRPIDQFVQAHSLGARQRIEMFIRVCEAVEFAHQSLVIHCDLKPSNILVSADGRARVLDFGICRLLHYVGRCDTEGSGPIPALTPQFASPEQLRGEPCTTSSDVYSLGLLLRCLFDTNGAQATGLLTRIAQNNSTPDSHDMHAAPHLSIERRWKDLDWIVRRATQPNAQHRYPSVRALIADLQNVLGTRPVIARASTRGYRMERWARRNSLLAFSATLVVATVALGVAGVVQAWKRESTEHRTAVAATGFLEDLLGTSTPWALQQDRFSLSFLEEASRQAGSELREQPAVELSVRMSLARIYASLWEWPHALRESLRAEQLARVLYGDPHEAVGDALALVGRAQTWAREPIAVHTQKSCLAIRDRLYHAAHPKIAETYINLGFAMWWTTPKSRWGEADANYRKGIELLRQSGDQGLADFGRALFSYVNFGREYGLPRDQLREMAREAVDVFDRSHERPSRYSRGALLSYSELLVDSDRPGEAIAYLQRFLMQYGDAELADPQLRRASWLRGQLAHLDGDSDTAFLWYLRAAKGDMADNAWQSYFDSKEIQAVTFREIEQVTDLRELLSWIESSFLPRLKRCDAELGGMLEYLTWPLLLGSEAARAENVMEALIQFHARSCPDIPKQRLALHQSLLEARLRNSASDPSPEPPLFDGQIDGQNPLLTRRAQVTPR